MKKKLLVIASVLTLSIVGFSSTALAWSTYYVERYNTQGSSYKIMTSDATTVCTLLRVGIRETDTGSERAMCNIYNTSGVWVLEAVLQTSSDLDAWCGAICFTP
jgi:hypothetical protein